MRFDRRVFGSSGGYPIQPPLIKFFKRLLTRPLAIQVFAKLNFLLPAPLLGFALGGERLAGLVPLSKL